MRVFTLLFLICPAQVLFAQRSELLTAENYTSYADAMFGRDAASVTSAEATTAVTEKAVASEATVAVEVTSSVPGKDTLSMKEIISAAESVATAIPVVPAPEVEKKIVKKGVGIWVSNESRENTNYCYALHRTAPIGSIIDLKNPMNGRIVSVKVIGRLPNIETYRGITVVVSAATARQLHILDKKFIINLLMPESLYAKQ